MSGWLDELLHGQPEIPDGGDSPVEIGPATASPPARAGGKADPGDIYAFGPSFVRFVTDRFAAVELLLANALAKREQHVRREGYRIITTGQTDSSGNATIVLFNCQPGQKFVLHRLYVHAQGYTWIAPFLGAGELLIQTDGMSWSGFSLASGSGQLPAIFTSGRLSAVEAQDGETLALKINAGPVSTRIEIRGSGVLTTVYGDDH